MCKDKAQSDRNDCKILKNNVAPLIAEHKANAATDEVHIKTVALPDQKVAFVVNTMVASCQAIKFKRNYI